MHRLPLFLSVPSFLWDRKLPECELFERTLTNGNMSETTKILDAFDKQAEIFFGSVNAFGVQKMLAISNLNLTEAPKKPVKVMYTALLYMNCVLLRTPKECAFLTSIMKTRAGLYMQQRRFPAAASDFEMMIYANQGDMCDVTQCELYGNLTVCNYLMRSYQKSKKYLQKYKIAKAKIDINSLGEPIRYAMYQIDLHITNFEWELLNLDDIAPTTNINMNIVTPYNGFNTSEHIPLSSGSCIYVNEGSKTSKTKRPGVYATATIPIGSSIIIEDTTMREVLLPLTLCEYCFDSQKQVYTCLECRYKTYCSLKCLMEDKPMHSTECHGYKNIWIIALDAKVLYSTFVRVSGLLDLRIFCLEPFRTLTTAKAVFNRVETILSKSSYQDSHWFKLLSKRPNYSQMTDNQYSTMFATVFRLAVFIEKKTNAIESFYGKLLMSDKQKLILLGAVLMRLHAHILLNTLDFEYPAPIEINPFNLIPYDEATDDVQCNINPIKYSRKKKLRNYYGKLDEESSIAKRSRDLHEKCVSLELSSVNMPALVHTEPCDAIIRPLDLYMDKVAEIHFLGNCPDDFFAKDNPERVAKRKTFLQKSIAQLSDDERIDFMMSFAENFHLFYGEYFLLHDLHPNIVVSLFCSTVRKFNHSCRPNVEVVLLENGSVLAKTTRQIEKGEELLISYKANHLRHIRCEREWFLKKHGIKCDCDVCKSPEEKETINARMSIYCSNCSDVILTTVNDRCPKCKASYKEVILKYRKFLWVILNEMHMITKGPQKTDDRDFYILCEIANRFINKSFLPHNEYYIYMQMNYAKFLTVKNFAKESIKIMHEVKDKMISCYYGERLDLYIVNMNFIIIIGKILLNNIEKECAALSIRELLDLCSLGFELLDSQKKILVFYELTHKDSMEINKYYSMFLVCQEKLLWDKSDVNLKKVRKKSGRASKFNDMPSLVP